MFTEEMVNETYYLIKQTNIVHRCWRNGDTFFKQLPAYNADNEMYFLTKMESTGYVPRWATRVNRELISMEFIETEPVTIPGMFLQYYDGVLRALKEANICHGDLTRYSVLVKDNRPILVDFAEARMLDTILDLPPKRPGGDAYWLEKTMTELAHDRT